VIGTTLQHYRIVRALGSGGMGDVYAAEDLRLHRLVALKVLPEALAGDADRLLRFEREAQAVAALNHPNIVTLYGVDEADGIHFLTMELVEGASLADRIPPHGLPLAEFLAIAVPLVDAISAAHQRGVVHRDLKPANVMVANDGRPKVLDFGLAKFTHDDPRAPRGETETASLVTAQHQVIGTAAYMSPEQAQGQPVDARSDIFSLGVLLYQMATGKRPFEGDSAISVLSSIIKDTPVSPAVVNPAVPVALERIVGRCLAKDPDRRYQSAADLRIDLEDLQGAVASARGGGVRHPGRRWRRWALAGVAATLVTATVLVAIVWRARPPGTGAPLALRPEFSQMTSSPGVEWFPSLSPDGKWLVYASTAPGPRHIYLQSTTGQNVLDLSGDSPADDDQPAFSPDGERIAFRSTREGGGLFVMGRTGEAVRRVTRTGFRPAWSPDGTHLAFATENVELNPQNAVGRSEIWTVNVSTGDARRLNEGDAVLPSWSPHNQRIAYTRRLEGHGIWTVPVTGGTPTPSVVSDDTRNWSPVWSPDGRYLYFTSDRAGSMNLWRVAIDEASGAVRADPEPLTTPAALCAHPSVSRDGARLAYASALVTANIQRLALDPGAGSVRGEPAWVTTGSRRWSSPDPSPDGAWVAFYSLVQPEGDLYVARPDGTGLRQLTGDAAKDRLPRWSPDGQWIATFSDRSGRLELWKIRPDGSDLTQMTDVGAAYFAWSPDGSRIAAATMLESGQPPRTLIFDPARPWARQTPEVSPPMEPAPARFAVNSWSTGGDRLVGQVEVKGRGTGIAIYSRRSRTYERLTDFGEWPVWLPDGRRVLFVADGNAFFIVDAHTKHARKIYSAARDVIGPPRLTRDGRTAYYSRRVTESDIWLLTLR